MKNWPFKFRHLSEPLLEFSSFVNDCRVFARIVSDKNDTLLLILLADVQIDDPARLIMRHTLLEIVKFAAVSTTLLDLDTIKLLIRKFIDDESEDALI